MNTIATFFAGIMAFFFGLLGHTQQTLIAPSTEITKYSPVIQEVLPNSVSSTTPKPAPNKVTTTFNQSSSSTTGGNAGSKKFSENLLNSTFNTINGPRSSYTKIIDNDPSATIKKDFPYQSHIIYTTKDNSRTYFVLCRETGGGCSWTYLNYLDVKQEMYHNTNLEYGEFALQSMQFIIPLETFDFNKLFVVNLETATQTLFYSKKNSNESLISQCHEPVGDFDANEYYSDIEFPSNGKIRIGVYKEIGQSSRECTHETMAKYEKIRDDIVDLTKF